MKYFTKYIYNQWFYLQIIIYSSFTLFATVALCYNVLHNTLLNQNSPEIFTFYVIVMVLILLILLVAIISSSVKCLDEVRSTNFLVNRMLNNYIDTELIETLKLFLQQIHEPKKVISCGFFYIDWTLMFSVKASF